MRKAIYFTLLATLSLFLLQGIWIHSMYQKHKAEYESLANNTFLKAIESEIGLRKKFEDPQNPKLLIKRAKDMTGEELASHKNDTIVSLTAMQKKGIAGSIAELFAQSEQDYQLLTNNPPKLPVVDSLMRTEFEKYDVPRCLYLYDKEGRIIKQFGQSNLNTTNYYQSIRKPIGTKGLLFMQLKTAIPQNAFVIQMLYLLIASACIVLIVIGCLIYQLTVIRRKEKLLQKREASVNGTVHDLKSPLNGVLTLLAWLAKSEPNAGKLDLIQKATLQVQQLTANIDSILISARGERQTIVLHQTMTDLPQLIERVKTTLPVQLTQKSYSFELINQLNNPMVLLDIPYMENVFKNLMENSLKYSDDGVKIIIELTAIDQNVRITVKDNGWGIAPKYQQKLFTQYYQVPREKERMQKGYGVGLCYAWHIIRAHGSKLKLYSCENDGCTFTFHLRQSN